MRRFLKAQMTIQLLYENITEGVTSPAQSPVDYFNENPDRFAQSENRTVRHILVDSINEAMLTIMSLDAGADFGQLVQEKSMDTGSAMYGGVIGPFDSRGTMVGGGGLVEPFTKAAFDLEKVGDYTPVPVVTDYGYHVIILDDITPGRTLSFDEIEDDLTYELLSVAKDEFFQEYVYQALEASVIETLDEYAAN